MKKAIIVLLALAGVTMAGDLGYSNVPAADNDVVVTGISGSPSYSVSLSTLSNGRIWNDKSGSFYWNAVTGVETFNITVDGEYALWQFAYQSGADTNAPEEFIFNFVGKSSITTGSDFSIVSAKSVTLNLDAYGSIYSGAAIATGGNDVDYIITTATDLSALTTTQVYTRDLIISNVGAIWYSDHYLNEGNEGTFSISDANLDAANYKAVGLISVNDIDKLNAGEYALALTGTSKLQLVVKAIPEPTTATLSILALAGLATRSRRK